MTCWLPTACGIVRAQLQPVAGEHSARITDSTGIARGASDWQEASAGEEGDAVAAEVGELPSRQGESDSDGDDVAGGGLLVSFDGSQAGRRKMPSAIAQQWFAQDVFQVRPLAQAAA